MSSFFSVAKFAHIFFDWSVLFPFPQSFIIILLFFVILTRVMKWKMQNMMLGLVIWWSKYWSKTHKIGKPWGWVAMQAKTKSYNYLQVTGLANTQYPWRIPCRRRERGTARRKLWRSRDSESILANRRSSTTSSVPFYVAKFPFW